jgi:hypothetical protein
MSRSITKFLKITIGAIVGVMLLFLIIGIMLPHPTTTTEKTGSSAEEHPDQSKEWMQITSADALNISNAATELSNVLSNSGDITQIKTLTLYIETETNTSSYESANYYVNADLEPAQQKYADMMGSYGAFAKRIDLSLEHINAGNTAEAEVTTEDAVESLKRGNKHYAEYKTMIEDFKKKHP